MVKVEEHDTDDSSDEVFLYENVGSSSSKPSFCQGKEVKTKDDDVGASSGHEFLCRNVGSSSLRPSSCPAIVKEENQPSSSFGDLKSYFVGMGFSSVLVDKVIEENGPSDVNLLLEALINSSKSSPEESDSWEDFEKEEVKSPAEFTSDCKQEIEDQSGPSSAELDKKSYLLMMDFSEEQIGLAISRLGP